MPVAGLEPALCCHKQILSLPRLPFRHTGSLLSQPTLIVPYFFVIDKKFFGRKQAFTCSAAFLFKNLLINREAVKGCKIVLRSFRPADKLHTAVFF